MKTLYIILCQTRAWQLTYDNLARNCLDSLPADLALCVGTRHEQDNPLYHRARYCWRVPEETPDNDPKVWGKFDCRQWEQYERWMDEADAALGGNGQWRKLLGLSDRLMGPIQNGGSGAILYYFRWFLLQRLRASGALDEYDWFVISRSDFQFLLPHPPVTMMDPQKIYVPDGERYHNGMTDRHIVLSRQQIEPVLESVRDIWRAGDSIAAEAHQLYGPETLLWYLLQRNKLADRVKWYPYTMFAVRGREDGTRWETGLWDETMGCYVKYVTEYQQYLRYRDRIRTVEDWAVFLQ